MHEVGEGAQAHVSIESVAYAHMGCPAAALGLRHGDATRDDNGAVRVSEQQIVR